jgi:homoserine/homoserine lactone efflux protein
MDGYLLFATIYFVAAATPGADTMLLLGRTLHAGWRAAVPYSLGITLAKTVMVTVAYFGLSALASFSPVVFAFLKAFGVGFLLYKAVRLWLAKPAEVGMARDGFWRGLGAAFVVGASNPTALMFYIAVVPQVAAQTEPFWLALIVIMGFMIVSLIYIGLASQIRSWISTGENQRLINRCVAVLFVAIAALVLAR